MQSLKNLYLICRLGTTEPNQFKIKIQSTYNAKKSKAKSDIFNAICIQIFSNALLEDKRPKTLHGQQPEMAFCVSKPILGADFKNIFTFFFSAISVL